MQAVRQASIEAKWHDVAGEVRGLARTDVGETRNEHRTDGIVIANDRRGAALQGGPNARQLTSVEKLAVRQMDIGKGDFAHLNDLRAAARQAAGQPRCR